MGLLYLHNFGVFFLALEAQSLAFASLCAWRDWRLLTLPLRCPFWGERYLVESQNCGPFSGVGYREILL